MPEEKRPILNDRTTKRGSELILLKRLHGGGREVGGIHGVVTEEFPCAAMKSIGARSRNDICGRARVLTELCVGIVSENAEFRDGIHRRLENETGVHRIHIPGAVNQEIVGFRALSVDHVRLSVSQRTPGIFKSGGQRNDSGLEQAKLGKVATVKRKIENVGLEHGLAETRDGGLDQFGIGAYLNFLSLGAHHKTHRNDDGPVHIDRDSFLYILLEALGRNFHTIIANRQFNDNVIAIAVADRCAGQAGIDLSSSD
jgi:hypothetical protein